MILDKLKAIWGAIKAFFVMFDLRFWLFTALFLVYFFQEIIPSFPGGIEAAAIVGGLLYVGLTIFQGVTNEKIKWPWNR